MADFLAFFESQIGYLIAVFGILSVSAGLGGWEWLLNWNRRYPIARLIENVGGPEATRTIWIMSGIAMMILGVLMIFGVVHVPPGT
jgi:hypothetical protein